jgi:hypothetical protein
VSRSKWAAYTAMACVAASAGAAVSGESKSSLLKPVPDSQLRDMSTDRPDKTESPYTVDAGRMQIETDLVVFTHDRSAGITMNTLDLMPFNVKLGVTNTTDLQVVYGAFSRVHTSGGGPTDAEYGFGDLVVRVKHNLWGNDGGRTAFAVMPFVKIPTGTLATLGDDVEGGLIVPLAVDIGHGFGLGLMTEIDFLKTESGSYEPAFVNSATVSVDLTDRLGLYAEVFVERTTEAGAETIVTLDGGLTYAVTRNLQLDAGANVGVTEAADDLSVFIGMSQRY